MDIGRKNDVFWMLDALGDLGGVLYILEQVKMNLLQLIK